MSSLAPPQTHLARLSQPQVTQTPGGAFIKKNWRTIYTSIAMVVDLLVIYIARLSAYGLTYPDRFSVHMILSSFEHFGAYCLVAYFGTAVVNGLYRSCYRSTLKRQFRIAANSYIYGSLLYVTLIFALRLHLDSRAFVLLLFMILPAAFAVERFFLHRFNAAMQRRGYGLSNALIVGTDEKALQSFRRFREFPELGYNIVGFISSNGQVEFLGAQSYEFQDLPEIAEKENIECILLPTDSIVENGYSHLETLCRKKKIKLKIISSGAEALLEKANVHDIAGITLYAPSEKRNQRLRRGVKRAFDLVGSAIGIALLSPLFLVIAVAIKVESKGPILFRQWRALAKGWERFTFYKFRTMVEGADIQKNHLYDHNESNGALFKIKDDPRMTKVGRMLRRWSLDEIPQLFNVLKGEMSLVGPRPLPVEDLDRLASQESLGGHYVKRAEAIPGITGLWQVSGRSNLGFTEMVLLDLYYIENQSLILDLEILFATIPVVLFGKGAY